MTKAFFCNICGYQGITHYKLNVPWCPQCHSMHRHRTVHWFLKHFLPERPIKFLHYAPEECIVNLLKDYDNVDYLSIDIDPSKAMKQEDAHCLSFPNNSFDYILNSCVLEHVRDDRQALLQMHRVLKPGGTAIIDIPLHYVNTTEEYSKPDKWGHYRYYGIDFPAKLHEAGFTWQELNVRHFLSDNKIALNGMKVEGIYLCRKEK